MGPGFPAPETFVFLERTAKANAQALRDVQRFARQAREAGDTDAALHFERMAVHLRRKLTPAR